MSEQVVRGPWPDPADPRSMDELAFMEWLADRLPVINVAIDIHLCDEGGH